MDTATNAELLRLPVDHQRQALLRLSPAMSADDLARHRRQTCLALLREVNRLEAELETLLASPALEACVDADAIARSRAAVSQFRTQILQFSAGAACTPSLADQPLESA